MKIRPTSVTFTQYAAAAGQLRSTLDLSYYTTNKTAPTTPQTPTTPATPTVPATPPTPTTTTTTTVPVPKPTRLASGRRTITKAGTVTVTLKLTKTARKLLKRHPAARLVLTTTLTLTNHRTLRTTKTLPRSFPMR